jgi:hypothetical protein
VPTFPLMPRDNQPAEDTSDETTSPSAEESLAEPTTEQPTTDDQPLTPAPGSLLPPEAQGEVNGGPLGCCLGTIAGLFFTFLLVMSASLLLSNGGYLSFATLPVLLAGTVLGGYFGWRIGKKLYREYEPPVVKERRPKPRRV